MVTRARSVSIAIGQRDPVLDLASQDDDLVAERCIFGDQTAVST